MIDDAATKQCPECAESIKAEAIKCRFCGYGYPKVKPDIKPMPADQFARLEAKVARGESLDPTEEAAVQAQQGSGAAENRARAYSLFCAHLQRLSDKVGQEVIQAERRLAERQWRNAQNGGRSHKGLFVVSPLAWAVRKTWDGKPKR